MKFIFIGILLIIVSCSSKPKIGGERIVVDTGYLEGKKPNWVSDSRVSWTENGQLFWKSRSTVRGDQKIDSCFTMAKLAFREELLKEIQTDIKSELNYATEGVSETDAIALNSMITEEANGRLRGAKVKELTFERYVINDNERIDCFVLGALNEIEYSKLKLAIYSRIQQISPELSEALKNRQRNFFKSTSGDQNNTVTENESL